MNKWLFHAVAGLAILIFAGAAGCIGNKKNLSST